MPSHELAHQELTEHAQSLGIDMARKPTDKVVIFATEALTPLGDLEETFADMLEGRSGIQAFPETQNARTSIGGLIDFDPGLHYTKQELKRMEPAVALADMLTRKLARDADLLDAKGKLKKSIDPERFGIWIGSGIGQVDKLIEIHKTIEAGVDKVTGEKSITQGTEDIDVFEAIKVFPQEMVGRPAMSLGARGWSGTLPTACATGASNTVELYRLIKDGYLDAGIAGGVEYVLQTHPVELTAIFAKLGVTSARSDQPRQASRPFDKDRDGFVPASGGAVLGIASEAFAHEHELPILAEIFNARSSIDGHHPTDMVVENVARTVLRSLYDEQTKGYYLPDVVLAHATSTKKGDTNEAEVIRHAFGNLAKEVSVGALKGNVGHMLGGAGSVNTAIGVEVLQNGIVPPIANLDEPSEGLEDIQLVRDEPLKKPIDIVSTVAYGFGGFNASVSLRRYHSE